MDWNPSFEQELQHIHVGRAQQQQPHDPEYGYHAQQTQAQQHYSSLAQSNFDIPYAPTLPFGLRLAAAISYIFGWATGFIFFSSRRSTIASCAFTPSNRSSFLVV